MKYFNNNQNIHYFFFFILSLNYLIPLILFGNTTLFYIDSLDSEIVYNKIIGKILKGDFDSVKIFLNGEISPLFLRRIFHPYSLIYSIFNHELAYWTIDILVKLVSYISFFIFSKKISKNIFISAFVSCLYASANLPTHEGFGLAILPYLIYLVLFKETINTKNILIIIFFGLNSDLLFAGFALPGVTVAILLLVDKKKYYHFFKIFTIFSLSLILANANMVFLVIENFEFHRNEMSRNTLNFIESIFYFFENLIKIPTGPSYRFLMTLPFSLFVIPTIIISIFSKKKSKNFNFSHNNNCYCYFSSK